QALLPAPPRHSQKGVHRTRGIRTHEPLRPERTLTARPGILPERRGPTTADRNSDRSKCLSKRRCWFCGVPSAPPVSFLPNVNHASCGVPSSLQLHGCHLPEDVL